MTCNTRPPQDKICAYEYTVRRGDSFYLIAQRLGVPLRDLLAANANVNPARLMVGDVLCIPMEEDDAPPAEPEVPDADDNLDDLDQPARPEPEEPLDQDMAVCPESQRHTVQSGETIADIQLSSGLNLNTLRTANPAADLDNLTAGQVLCVPDTNIPCPVTITVLQPGDTLESAALRLNTSIASLLRANPCLAPGDFVPGVSIHIPQK